MKLATRILLVLLVVGAVIWSLVLHKRMKAEKQEEPDASWDYKIGLPITAPTHPSNVRVQLQSNPAANGTQAWFATYSANGQVTKFRIELDPTDRTEMHGIPMKFGKGRLVAVAGSNPEPLLGALATALDGKVPVGAPRQSQLPFDYVHFGNDMSPIPGGGYQFKPKGDWTAMKMFFGEGEQSATVYFSVNRNAGEGEFSMSNSDDGDDVLRYLATIL